MSNNNTSNTSAAGDNNDNPTLRGVLLLKLLTHYGEYLYLFLYYVEKYSYFILKYIYLILNALYSTCSKKWYQMYTTPTMKPTLWKKEKRGKMGDWEAPQAQHFVLHIQHEENGVVDTIHTSSRHHTILKNQKHIL